MTNRPAIFHREIASHINDPLLAVAAPREHAKSTNVDTIWTLWELYFKLFHYQIFIGDTAQQAEDRLAEIVNEIENNELLCQDFGRLKPDMPSKWTDQAIITSTNVKIEALGVGSKIRGRKHLQWRPDRLVFDDIENEENVNTKEQREKLANWFFRAAMNARQKYGSRARIIGTILHFDSLLNNIMAPDKYTAWTKLKFRAVNYNPQGMPYALWPDQWSLAELAARKAEIGTSNFEQEFNNNPSDEEAAIIKRAWIKYHDYVDPADPVIKAMTKLMRIDPAIKQGEKNDKFALCVCGIDEAGKIRTLAAYTDRLTFHQQIETIFNYYLIWKDNLTEIHVENNAYQDALKQEIDRVGAERRIYPPVKGKTTSKDKSLRLKAQSGLIENGHVEFSREHHELIDQLCDFGKTRFDDLMDAFIGCVEGIRTGSSSFLEYMKNEKEKAKQNPAQSFLQTFGKNLTR